VIDLANVVNEEDIPSTSTDVQAAKTSQLQTLTEFHPVARSVTIMVDPQEEELRIETSEDILARQVEIENAREA
jgi:hypothetical protein